MTLQALTYFAAAAEEGNLTRAAKRCFVTQPALSRAIAELERELGCPLLIRKNKGVSLTPAGEVCLSGARRILKECELLARQVHEGSGSTAGTINIGYLFNGSLNFFAGMLKQASQVFPHIELHTTYEHFKDAKRMLKTGELDFVLLAEPSARGLGAVDLLTVFPGGLYVVAHHTHRLFAQEAVGPVGAPLPFRGHAFGLPRARHRAQSGVLRQKTGRYDRLCHPQGGPGRHHLRGLGRRQQRHPHPPHFRLPHRVRHQARARQKQRKPRRPHLL